MNKAVSKILRTGCQLIVALAATGLVDVIASGLTPTQAATVLAVSHFTVTVAQNVLEHLTGTEILAPKASGEL